jgi:DNA invertase Pin-like site-specific DNA recombinase
MTPLAAVVSPRGGALRSEKVGSWQRDRLAVVYVRQSTVQQVLDHQESTRLQYGLADRAQALGWAADRVLVIDEALGRSGTRADERAGFQRLVSEVSLDHVGLILGLEMSRLARSNRDWYQLQELCALFRTLIADLDGVYDPAQYNDRLLLGLKGTLSEAELHVLKQRMHEGRRNKARRGELRFALLIGYVRGPEGTIDFDPDEQVQAVVRLIFRKFTELGTLYEAERARRQYDAVEPENRLVARTLERQWEAKLVAQQQLEEAYHRFLQEQPRTFSEAERAAIRRLAADIPALWAASTTTAANREELLRQIIETVVVAADGKSERVQVTIRWVGGGETAGTVIRPIRHASDLRTYGEICEQDVWRNLRAGADLDAGPSAGREHRRAPEWGGIPARRRWRFRGASNPRAAAPAAAHRAPPPHETEPRGMVERRSGPGARAPEREPATLDSAWLDPRAPGVHGPAPLDRLGGRRRTGPAAPASATIVGRRDSPALTSTGGGASWPRILNGSRGMAVVWLGRLGSRGCW